MTKQNNGKTPDIIEYKEKFLDIEQHIIKIESINNLLIAYADEYSPEASIIASLISKQLEKIYKILSK